MFENSEWALKFAEYLDIGMMYSRDKEYHISVEIFKAIFDSIGNGEE
ncbi:hypothetical protein [Clostridium gasigenes]|uniref:Uncharacterized protein n=1 Tax=Clostridium gasigenes TaxID=94869 RepID=A0A7X0VRR0_9CLOT|nr:hypothetical protein [Clostridium gasigenes]MBB6714870.1 hypothetical protein [Clostridium gasigenes]